MTPDQKQTLDDIAIELFEYIDSVKAIKDFFDELPVKKPIASPYLNFRDALFHYNKMYRAARDGDNFGFIRQGACIEEHLNRGLKDFVTHLCTNFYILILHKMIDSRAKFVDSDIRQNLRQVYHGLKNLVVEIRLDGQTLKHFDNHKNVWLPKFVDLIEEFDNILDKYPPLRPYYNRLGAEMRKLPKKLNSCP